MTRVFGALRRHFNERRPVVLLAQGYALYMLIGCVLLALPFTHTDNPPPLIDALFTAVSAVSTTGLVTVSPSGSFNTLGELIILALIQLGGIGYMTLGSFVLLTVRHRLDRRHSELAEEAFVLPEGTDLARFIRGVVLFSLSIESAGAIALSFAFAASDTPMPIWNGIFHAVSAFCTAGFSLFDTSLEAFSDNITINLVVAILSYLGAIGFIVMGDWWLWATGARKPALTSRIIARVTFVLAVIGTTVLALTDPRLASFALTERVLGAFFQTMTAMTTVGFDTVPINTLGAASILLVIVAMIMGAAPSGTGGGLKATTLAILYGGVRAGLAGRAHIRLLGQRIDSARVMTALAILGLYLGCLVIGCAVLLMIDHQDALTLVFEAASALGTVGLSLGATGDLSTPGKIVIMVLMFIGRLGPLSAGMALVPAARDAPYFREGRADIAV